MRQIRVLVVEDSLVFRELMVQNLNKDPAITVVATAKDPFEAREAILKHKPDVMTLDIEMPKMNGIDFLKMLMPKNPIPVVMISSLSDKVFDALNAGAVDFVEFHVAPKLLGGRESIPVLGGDSPESMGDALELQRMRSFTCGNDLIINGFLRRM